MRPAAGRRSPSRSRWNADTGATGTAAADAGTAAEHAAETVRARWVIAADGAKRSMRTLLGVGQDDFGFNERWANFDAEWKGDVPERPDTCTPSSATCG